MLLRVDYESTSGCTPGALEEELRALVRRPFVIDARASTLLRVSIAQVDEATMHAHVSFDGRAGEDARDIDSKTCIELLQSVALVTSTWIEAEPAVSPVRPSSPPAGAPAVEPSAHAPKPAAKKPSARPAMPSVHLGGHLAAFVGLTETPAFGGDASFSYRWHEGRYEVRGALRALAARRMQGDVDATYVLAETMFDGCTNLIRHRLTVGPCLRIDPGVLYLRANDDTHVLPWLGLAAGIHGGVQAGKSTIELEIFVGSPVTGYRVERDETTLVPFRTITVSAGLGVLFPIL